jgi:hypothetical protein
VVLTKSAGPLFGPSGGSALFDALLGTSWMHWVFARYRSRIVHPVMSWPPWSGTTDRSR